MARATKLCELSLQEVKLLVAEAVKLQLSLERGTAATIYPLKVAEALIRALNLRKPHGPERSLIVDIILKDLREVVDLKGRRWRLNGHRPPFKKGGTQMHYAVYYVRADLYLSELARRMRPECPLHPFKVCSLKNLSAVPLD